MNVLLWILLLLLRGICSWIPHRGVVSTGLKNNTKRQVWLVWFQPCTGPPTLALPEVIWSKFGFSSELSTLPYSAASSSWLPSMAHCNIQFPSKTVMSIRKVPLGVLHRFWHPEYAPPQPPATVGTHVLLGPFFWRLLHDRIAYRVPLCGGTPQCTSLLSVAALEKWNHLAIC